MKIKFDENIGSRGVALLKSAGHDVMTVRDQNLQGAKDEVLFEVCVEEQRVLITLDHDFGQVLRFPPAQSAGIVILERTGRNDFDCAAGPDTRLSCTG
jgi:predicted nuclease of predicted toxin-antitoxin system